MASWGVMPRERHTFVKVLDAAQREAHFDVEMALVLVQQVWRMGNDDRVVDNTTAAHRVHCASSVRRTAAVEWVNLILAVCGLVVERLGEVALAHTVHHARSSWKRRPALVVRHVSHNELQQLLIVCCRRLEGMSIGWVALVTKVVAIWWERQFGAHTLVNVVDRLQAVLGRQDDEDVRMRQAAFLELDHMQVCYDSAKNAVFVELRAQSVELEAEDACNQVWTVLYLCTLQHAASGGSVWQRVNVQRRVCASRARACWPGASSRATSSHLGLAVMVMKKEGLPFLRTHAIASW